MRGYFLNSKLIKLSSNNKLNIYLNGSNSTIHFLNLCINDLDLLLSTNYCHIIKTNIYLFIGGRVNT